MEVNLDLRNGLHMEHREQHDTKKCQKPC